MNCVTENDCFPFCLLLLFSRSVASDSLRPHGPAHQASLSIIISQSLLKVMSIELVIPSNHLVLCCSLLLLSSIFSSIRVFSKESVLRIRWPKYWSFSFNISPSNEHPGLMSFRMDWLDLPYHWSSMIVTFCYTWKYSGFYSFFFLFFSVCV